MKNSKFEKLLNENGYTDVHCHIIPNVDDGSKSDDETEAMIRIAYDDGIRRIITTPHYNPERVIADIEKINEKVDLLRQKSYGIDFLYGSEIAYCSEAIDSVESGKAYTLAGTKYVLVEFRPSDSSRRIRDGLNDFVMNGYIPILAHEERYVSLYEDISLTSELIDMGAFIQINAMSILGLNGSAAKKFVKALLKRNYVHLVGTDAHSPRTRSPHIDEAARYILKKYGEDVAIKIFFTNPSLLLENEYIN